MYGRSARHWEKFWKKQKIKRDNEKIKEKI